jgi:hypothetical protein
MLSNSLAGNEAHQASQTGGLKQGISEKRKARYISYHNVSHYLPPCKMYRNWKPIITCVFPILETVNTGVLQALDQRITRLFGKIKKNVKKGKVVANHVFPVPGVGFYKGRAPLHSLRSKL